MMREPRIDYNALSLGEFPILSRIDCGTHSLWAEDVGND